MIQNVVFDFGQVLIHFIPASIISHYTKDAEDAALLESVLFSRRYWDQLDDGSVTNDEMLAQCYPLLPECLHGVAREIMYGWIYHIPEIEGMHELVRALEARSDIKLYLLSNISVYFAEHADEIPILSHFDGCIYSGVCKRIKPHADIYEHLCNTFSLLPQETVFIDDNPQNIAAARAFGITGYLFDGDAAKLSAYLNTVLSD